MPWYQYTVLSGRPLPLVPVALRHQGRYVRLPALVDSGADTSLLDLEYALALGLESSDARRAQVTTAGGGQLIVWRWPSVRLQLESAGERFPFCGTFVEAATEGDFVNLLGRDDFFQRFVVQFWDPAQLLNIDLSPDFPLQA